MKCPFCSTENRDDRDLCYHCNKDLSMLRLIVNKAKHHYNLALEHAERGRYYEAITELQNALDLDRTHKNARVVLGTIYARQNKFDKAIEEWKKGLALDSGLLKAHEYILKAQKVSEALPVIRWIKVFAVALVISIVIIISLVVGGQTQKKDMPILQRAWKAYNDNNYSAALERLDELVQMSSDDSIRLASFVLRDVIRDTIRRSVSALKQGLVEGNLWEVLEEAKDLEHIVPDAKTAVLLDHVKEEARLRLIRESLISVQQYLETGKGFEETYSATRRVAETFKDDKDVSELLQRMGEMKEKFVGIQLAKLNEEHGSGGDENSAFVAATALLERFESSQASEQVREFIRQLEKQMISKQIDRAEIALKANDFTTAYAALSETQRFHSSDDETSHRIALISERLQEEEVNAFLSNLQELNRQKRYEEALAVADRGTTASLGGDEKETLEKELGQARRGYAIASYEWMEARDPQYEEARISISEAEKTAQIYEFVLENLPSRYRKWATDNIIFYSGVSLLKIGKYEEGEALFERLQEEYPQSPYLKFVPILLERFRG